MLKVSATQILAERARIIEELRATSPGSLQAAVPASPDLVSPHKFFAPAPYAGAIARDAILQRIAAQPDVRVFMLQGPAGHGKSTTLQQIKATHEADGWHTVWLTFDDADNDPQRLAIHMQALVELLSRADAQRGSHTDAATARRRRRADWVLDRLSSLQRPAAIFLDEFQTLRNRSILAFFRDLFERVPDKVRIFVGSRSLPEIGLAKLLVNNVAQVVNADDLRFSPAEVSEFFSGSGSGGVRVSGEEIGTIYRRTEGWPAALQLYRLTLNSPEVRSSLDDFGLHSPRQLAEYLADNVLALQAPRTQAFLLRTSLLTRLTAPLCDLVTGRSDSQEVLLELERSGLFVRSLDAEGRWFKYHGLFSTILAESFCRRSDAQAREVHQRAARWHLEQRQYEEAVHHALLCRDFDLAADTLDTWAGRLIASAHLMTVERWFDRMPIEHVVARPSLAIKVAWALMFLRRHQKLRPLIEQLRRMPLTDLPAQHNPSLMLAMAEVFEDDIPRAYETIARLQIHDRADEGFSAFEIGAAENVIAFRDSSLGDFEGSRRVLGLAHAFNQRGGATFSGGYTAAIGGVNLVLQGRLPEALERFRRDVPAPGDQIDKSFASAALASCHIWALYEANELDAVEALCGQYHDDISGSVILDFIAVALVSMVRLNDVRGRKEQALELLDEIERIGHDSGWVRLIRIADWERARRALVTGDVQRAKTIVAHMPPLVRIPPAGWISLAEDLGSETLGRIRLAIHDGDFEAAGTQLAAELTRQPGRSYRRMKLHLLEAMLRQREGANNAAHRSLRKALQIGGPGRYVRSFLDAGDGIVQLLREEYQSIHERAVRDDAGDDEHRVFIEQLLGASGTDLSRAPASNTKSLLEPLSDREQQILVFLANGVSNREMATRLFVSENTVKFHLKNIYAKLAVSSRLQAIHTARQLGLVH